MSLRYHSKLYGLWKVILRKLFLGQGATEEHLIRGMRGNVFPSTFPIPSCSCGFESRGNAVPFRITLRDTEMGQLQVL